MQTIKISIATDADGDFTVDTAPVSGRVLQYRYTVDATSPLATGADITIVGRETALPIVSQLNIGTASFTKAPRQPVHDSAGAASLYAAGGEPVEDYIFANEPMTVTIAEGGDTKVGVLHIWVG